MYIYMGGYLILLIIFGSGFLKIVEFFIKINSRFQFFENFQHQGTHGFP